MDMPKACFLICCIISFDSYFFVEKQLCYKTEKIWNYNTVQKSKPVNSLKCIQEEVNSYYET